MSRTRVQAIAPYMLAVVLTVIATCCTVFWPILHSLHSLGPFLVAVVIVAWFGGLIPSLLTILLSTISFAYFIAPPSGFGIGLWQDKVRLITFIIISFMFSILHAARVAAEEKSRLMVQRLSLALEATQFGVWDLNLATGEVWHSASMEEIYGRSADRFGQSYEVFLGYVHPEDRDFVHRTVTRAIEGGEEYHIQHRIVMPNNDVRWVSTRGKVYLDKKRQAERLVAVTGDITNRPGASLPPMARPPAVPVSSDSPSHMPTQTDFQRSNPLPA